MSVGERTRTGCATHEGGAASGRTEGRAGGQHRYERTDVRVGRRGRVAPDRWTDATLGGGLAVNGRAGRRMDERGLEIIQQPKIVLAKKKSRLFPPEINDGGGGESIQGILSDYQFTAMSDMYVNTYVSWSAKPRHQVRKQFNQIMYVNIICTSVTQAIAAEIAATPANRNKVSSHGIAFNSRRKFSTYRRMR